MTQTNKQKNPSPTGFRPVSSRMISCLTEAVSHTGGNDGGEGEELQFHCDMNTINISVQ